ncbi:MAG: hypothetical protein LBV43_02205 [Prevotella sp.]|jgi:hypothetical protein|nr:hypothetical protein [Prevotella sp.]
MNLSLIKRHFGKGFQMSVITKAVICITLLIPLNLFYSCSSDDDEQDPPVDTSKPYSVNISNSNVNMPSGGTITSEFSDSPTGSEIGKAVDNNVNTSFVTSHSKFHILWNGNQTTAVNYYYLISSEASSASDPKSWTLSGSNNNQNWTIVDKQTDQTFSKRQEKKEYRFKNETAYQYYKLAIQSNNGASTTQIAEWSMQNVLDPLAPYSVTITSTNENMPSGGIITSQYSDFPEGSGIGKVVDSKVNTKFVTNYSKFYILWAGSSSEPVSNYTLTSADDAPAKDPKSWSLSGSNDNATWTLLDKQEDQTFAERGETKVYNFENKISYKYYILEIEDNGGDASTQIAEWTMEMIWTDYDELVQYTNGFSHSDITPMGNFFENRHVTTDANKIWLNDASQDTPMREGDDRRLEERTVNLYPYGEPIPADVNQHGIGNCCAVAVFASMAYNHPEFIKSIIKDNGDKTYTVSMFDPQGEPIKVSVNSNILVGNNGGMVAGTGKNDVPTWSTILEKAMIKYNYIYNINGNYDLGGIGTEHVSPLFTGNGDSFAVEPGKMTGKELARIVSVCLKQGKFVIGGFRNSDVPVDGSKTVNFHAYTFMHPANKKSLFVMRNPWGGNPDVDGTKDGLLNISDNSTIPPLIDLRIVEPGAAGNIGATKPYTPPTLKGAEAKMHVADHVLRPSQRRN